MPYVHYGGRSVGIRYDRMFVLSLKVSAQSDMFHVGRNHPGVRCPCGSLHWMLFLAKNMTLSWLCSKASRRLPFKIMRHTIKQLQ